MRTHETHRGASFTALPSPLLYSRCLRRLFSQRWWLLSMSMSCLPSQTTEHGRRPAKHTDNTARHGAAFRWNNMAASPCTASLIEVEVERRVRPGHTEQQEATSNNSSADRLLQTENICSRQKMSGCAYLAVAEYNMAVATTSMSELSIASHVRHSERRNQRCTWQPPELQDLQRRRQTRRLNIAS